MVERLQVVDHVADRLPEGFPLDVADAISSGVKKQAARLPD
ncbi:hypothetical protein ABU178_17845 [Pantoea osteomyelitidis]|uniref:Uncharacterized protein n=1 Tax=Pantoea osteomyelitidis TaxID=3230026 RepID=A0ABW7Q0A8_9GAMM